MINIIFFEDDEKIVRIIRAEATTQAEGAAWEVVRNVFNAAYEMLWVAGRVTYKEYPRESNLPPQSIEIHIVDYKKSMNHIINGLYRWAGAIVGWINVSYVFSQQEGDLNK